MTQVKHTPLPWRLQNHASPQGDFGVYCDNNKGNQSATIARCNSDMVRLGVNEANAAFIVKACNAHYELLSAITFILSDLNSKLDYEAREILLAAIAKAEGKNP